ncbi:MAG: M3 family metallopeptidase [Candidatus Pacearchaeota archaeon]|nr:M3 family metallopeptidase [Candidatus Pacearchaeota archaeon]
MGDLDQVVWGIDGIRGSVLTRKLKKPISRMNEAEILAELRKVDRELSWCEEETDYEGFHRFGGRENPRKDKAKEAERRKAKIGEPESVYNRLIARSLKVARNPLALRAADLRARRSLYDALENQEEFVERRNKTRECYGKKRLKIDGPGEISIGQAQRILQTEADPGIRKAIYCALRIELGDVEELFFDEIRTLNGLVAKIAPTAGHNFTNFFEVSANYCEAPSPEEIGGMMRRFVDETKEIYNKLVRELISGVQIDQWDLSYLMTQKDPFTKLEVPQDPKVLFGLGLSILKDLGYDSAFVDMLYDSKNPGVFLDIEQREGKIPGAATFSLGPFSFGKNMLFFEPVIFSGNPRKRWGVFPHEFGHGVHHHFSRRAVRRNGAIFFIESTPGSETISETHEDAAFDPIALEKYLGVKGDGAAHFAKWRLLNDLAQLYGMARVTLGELAIHSKGVEYARSGSLEAELLTRPEILRGKPTESTAYVTTPHIHGQPGYYFAYFVAALYERALSHSIREKNGTIFSPATARTLIDDIMVGNVAPMADRIRKATGESDFIGSVIRDFKDEYKKLAA